MREPLWSKRDLEKLKNLYEGGVPTFAIAADLNRSLSAIRTQAQIRVFRRPKGFGTREIAALRNRAVDCGLDADILPRNPTALRILIWLANDDICAKRDLDKFLSIEQSTRNKALQILKACGLVFVDDFSRSGEIILTRRAYRSRPEPGFADPANVRNGILPSMDELTDALDTWVAASCRNPASLDRYRDFAIRQLLNAQSGDIKHDAFFSIFIDTRAKSKEG
jgi:predicted transcriptional regulator